MNNATNTQSASSDSPPLLDETSYGYGKDDSIADQAITDQAESAAVTYKEINLNGKRIPYVARAGHLVTTDSYSSQHVAKIFYVSFSAVSDTPSERPITFFYNGGPGSSSVYLLLGSFGPRRIKTCIPGFTPPAPYELVDNQECLLDKTDLVFINPVGTAYSTAIAPRKNGDFWGVDEDAQSIKQFVKRYLTAFGRWNSAKFLFGESYGTPRTCVLAWRLHEDGVDLNGIILQSSILDYSREGDSVGLLPTLAANALYHEKASGPSEPADFPSYMEKIEKFARGPYASAIAAFPKVPPHVLEELSQYVGIPPVVLNYWKLELNLKSFLTSLLLEEGLAIGVYDGRVTADDTGIVASIGGGANDPSMTAVAGVYTAMWHAYLNGELRYTSTSPFMAQNDKIYPSWNFNHIDPTGARRDYDDFRTTGDLAAAMDLNPYLKVFSASGYYDAITPFFQTTLNLHGMPLRNEHARKNLKICNYPSGHMIYLDDGSRSSMKQDLAKFYDDACRPQKPGAEFNIAYKRRISRTPY
jgi:carboxypeptidase C (cathepsin A)